MAGVTTREHAEALDAADPLARFRARFEHAGDGVYLDGNSLGRQPSATRERVLAVLDHWSREVVSGWHDWIDLPLRAGDARGALLGAAPGEVIAPASVTGHLYKLVCAARDARPGARRHAWGR